MGCWFVGVSLEGRTMTENDTMIRNKSGQPSTTPQPTEQVVTKATETIRPKSTKHQSTLEEAKAWVDSKGLQSPR